uniref:Vesicle transport protein n=1 Tax=Globodera pallida TaxID=36090 RepID=A0A183CK40_GLOPA
MGWIFAVCCFSVAFMPSLFVFRHFVAPDPLRIIMFVLGAFFWLCSLLLSSVVFAIFGPRFLLLAVFSSILFQELARALYFVLLYKAQGGLARLMAADAGRTGTASSMRLLYSSRHILAIVCGLGMGTSRGTVPAEFG